MTTTWFLTSYPFRCLGDVGGFMGLLLGGSVLTVCELLDLLIFNFFKKLTRRRQTEEKIRQRALEREREERERRQREAVQKVQNNGGSRIYQS